MRKKDDLLGIGRPPRSYGLARLIYLLFFAALVGGIVYLVPRFEWHAPVIQVKLPSNSVGVRPFDVEIKDRGRGLASVSVTLSAGGSEVPLLSERYDSLVTEKKSTFTLSPETIKGKEGPALLKVTAKDRSFWRFFRGNQATLQQEIVLDMTPPSLDLVADDRYVNFGGSGMVIYKTSPDTQKSGVKIADYFFPGYKTKTPGNYLVFFAHPYDLGEGAKAVIIAEDGAGNIRQMPLSYTLKGVRYRKSTLSLDDRFIESRVVPLLGNPSADKESLKALFLKVNRDLRKKNEERIKQLCSQSNPQMLWSEPFHQLANSKVEANFADQRTYIYKGETIDHAYHLGYDLAVTKNTPIESANDGIVVFAADLGIYGNTVILDHGLGIFTLYSHLSSVDVKVGDKIQRKQIIGKTGETGLAAGDHLHYAILVHGVPVLPLEWWDGKWINENVLSKLSDSSGDGASPAVKTTRKLKRK